MRNTRREFLKRSAAATTAISVPYFMTSRGSAAEPDEKPTLASIGVGGSRGRYNRGGAVAMQAANFGRMVAVCDVDAAHTSQFNKRFGGKLGEYNDYRQLLEKEKPQVVTIGTPDHWHVPIAIAALRAGADVYCEKPLTLTIDEGKQICKVVKETGKVFQVGTQQRSEYGHNFIRAVALAQGGYLGEKVNAYVAIGGAPGSGTIQPQEIPEGLDWDFWLGPAQSAPYSDTRRKIFRWFLEYSGGKMTDWGAHHIDIAQWALGKDKTGPVEVNGNGTLPPIVPEKFDFAAFFAGKATLPSAFNAPMQFHIDLKYADGSVLSVNNFYTSPDGATKFDNGILLEGSLGRIFVNRGRLSGKPWEDLGKDDRAKIDEAVVKLYNGKRLAGHMANFFDCRADNSMPVSDVFSHHRTMTSCHLCNINLMLGRKLQWDPDKEVFVGDEQATALISRPSRPKYL